MKLFLVVALGLWMLVFAAGFWWHVYLTILSFSIVENVLEGAGQVWALLCYSFFAVFFSVAALACLTAPRRMLRP